MVFLIDKLREKLGREEHEVPEEGFTDLNFKVGNTSGIDVTQQIPSELAERVGHAAQRGGGEMEVQVKNPSSFFIDRKDLYRVIEGLGLDVSIHSDPNVGYTALGKQQFDQTHDYFRKYLESFTSFAEEKKNRNLNFRLGRINPHISVSPVPPVEQGRPQGVALDPFAYSLTEVQREKMKQRRQEGKNIYDNKEFLRRFYRLFVLDEIGDTEYEQFERLYTKFSPKIDRAWRTAKNETLLRIWDQNTGGGYVDSIDDKAALLASASRSDPSIENIWTKEIYGKDDLDGSVSLSNVNVSNNLDINEIASLKDLSKFIQSIKIQQNLTNLGLLPRIIYHIKDDENIDNFSNRVDVDAYDGFEEDLWELIEEPLENAMNSIWEAGSEARDESGESDDETQPRVSLIPVQNKMSVVQRKLEIQQDKIWEKAYENNRGDLRDEVEKMFAGEEGYFTNGDDRSEEERHENFLRSVINNRLLERQMQTESNAFYRIFPAWMSCADQEYENEREDGSPHGLSHKGWDAPRFLWEALVEDRHGDDWKISSEDLKDPRQKKGYFEALKKDEVFRMDVAAAVGSVVMWTHFTQMNDQFDMDSNQYVKADSGRYTWIEWMNKYGVGINMEDMAGQPQQMFKIWRPFHAVAACRAINITARNQFDEIHEDLDDCPVKFTIDMEHVASFGVDPWKEMEQLAKWEKKIIKNLPGDISELPGDPEKPLAKMVRMYHLTKPGMETTQGVGHTHGPFRKGDVELYEWLFKMVKYGFARGSERASVMYEIGGEMAGTVYQAKLAMDLIQLGVEPEDLDPSRVDPSEDPKTEEEALIARFFDMDQANYSREWAKIEQHAFDPLEGLLEAEQFDYTYSSAAAIQNDNSPRDWPGEEYQ